MANFLNRLAARALGAAHVAEPVVPTLFASGFGLKPVEPHISFEAQQTVYTQEITPPVRGDHATLPKPAELSNFNPAPRLSMPASLSRGFPVQKETVSTSHEKRVPAPDDSVATTRPAGSPPIPDRQDVARPEEVNPLISDRGPGPWFELPETQSPGNITQMLEPRDGQLAAPGMRQAPRALELHPTMAARPQIASVRRDHAGPAEAHAPVVRVTIGRIDVRAQFPAPTPTPSARHARPAALSLEEYSKQRAEGKR